MIYVCDDKHDQFPSYTTENAQSHSLCDFTQRRRKRQLLNQSLCTNPVIALHSETQHISVLSTFYNTHTWREIVAVRDELAKQEIYLHLDWQVLISNAINN